MMSTNAVIAKTKLRTTKVYSYLQTGMYKQKAPLCKGSCRKATEGLFYHKFFAFTIPPSAFGCHLPCSYTREAFFYLPEVMQKNF